MKFAPSMTVGETLSQIGEKISQEIDDFGLFQPAISGKRTARWLRSDRTLQFYDLRTNVCALVFLSTSLFSISPVSVSFPPFSLPFCSSAAFCRGLILLMNVASAKKCGGRASRVYSSPQYLNLVN